MSTGPGHEQTLRAAEEWFGRHGLTYFVPEERAAAARALRLRRTLPLFAGVVLALVVAVVLLAVFADVISMVPALVISLLLVVAVWYGLTAVRARRIVTWALARTADSLRAVLPMTTRALPLLLLFVAFLFINTEVWQVCATIGVGDLWLAVLLFVLLAAGFLWARLPDEVDRATGRLAAGRVREVCAETPLAEAARSLEESRLGAAAPVRGFERTNLVLVLLVTQMAQVVLLSVAVFCFLMVFGALVISPEVTDSWLGSGQAHRIFGWDRLTRELVSVSVFLASFSGLYLTVSTVTDQTYRGQFFGSVTAELERAVGVRAVYLALRAGSSATA
ncbi:MAG: hypothetical protein QM638_05295 [Nocardioides sp.]|uniref:hypothetical protein n=1 Tax=Nocardioides sp. TaxID=35761 RepID=UPI0039E367E8